MMVDTIINNVTRILTACLKSTNKSLFKSALDQLEKASTQYGRSINKHLPMTLALVNRKYIMYQDRIHGLSLRLIENGGPSVHEFLVTVYPHFIASD